MPRKKILLIYTGGTIGMIRSSEGVYIPFNFDAFESQFPEVKKLSARITVYTVDPPLDSSNIGPDIWVRLAIYIAKNYDDYDGFVILHGSDTMAYTASALSFLLEGLYKPVIFTGSQLPIGEIRTDAKENLETAFEIAAHPDSPIKEVCIYFEYKLYRGNRTRKVHADVFGAFRSPNFRPIAEAGVNLRFYRPTPEDAYETIPFRAHESLDENVALIKFFPGISNKVIKATLSQPQVKAVIFESFGSGNLPESQELIDLVKEAVARDKILLNITQCSGGTVDMGRYATSKFLADHGVLGGSDLTTEAAVTKLMYLLAKYEDLDKVRYYLVRNIRGEMTAERAYTIG